MRFRTMLFYRLSPVIQAIGFGLIAYFVIYRLAAQGDVLLTYLLNLIFIAIALQLDGIAHRFAARRADDIRSMYSDMGAVQKAIFLSGQGFLRTAMYIFYIVVIVLANINTLRPGLLPFDLGGFFSSIEYGIILLFAVDRLKELLAVDKVWFDENLRL